MKSKIEIEKTLELYKLTFNGQHIFGTPEEFEELCLALEKFCYDEPTYKELEDRTFTLRNKVEKLEDELEQYKERELLLPRPMFMGRGLL